MAPQKKSRSNRSSKQQVPKKDYVSCPAIIDAAMYGKLDEMKEIALQDTKNLQARETDGWTIAHWAARRCAADMHQRGHLDILSFVADRAPTLLSAQADDGSTPAHYAASYGHDSVLNLLGDRDPGSLMVSDKEGNSAAHDATKHHRLTTLKLLIDRCPSLIYGMNKEQQRPCDFAVREEIKEFLKNAEKASMVPAVQLQNLTKEARLLNAQNAILAFKCRNYWDPLDKNKRTVQFTPPGKDETNLEFQSVFSEFNRTMSKANVLMITRFQDRAAHDAFMVFRDQIKVECKDNWNESLMEKWMFCTGPDLVNVLKNPNGQVFTRTTGPSAHYGDGIYVLREASLAADDAYPDSSGSKQMLLVWCVTGRYGVGKAGMDKPALIPGSNTKTFHSSVDNIAEPMTFVLQSPDYMYPAYVITYRD